MLTRVSSTLSKAVFRRWPEWRPYETTDLKRPGKHHYFSVEVSPINSKADRGLWLSHNIGFEIIVGFDVDHCHFWRKPSESSEQWRLRAFRFADAILRDEIVAVSWWAGDHCSCTTSANFKKVSPNTKFMRKRTWTSWRTRSWSGKYDRDVTRGK